MCLFVHMKHTTGRDAAARRAHVYADRCAQCGVALTETTRVAAHVVARPCGLPCGRPTLRTTCKKCNHVRHKPRGWWGCKLRLVRLPHVPK